MTERRIGGFLVLTEKWSWEDRQNNNSPLHMRVEYLIHTLIYKFINYFVLWYAKYSLYNMFNTAFTLLEFVERATV